MTDPDDPALIDLSRLSTITLANILAAARHSKRAARAITNALNLGGGSGDLAAVLESIEADPRREQIHALASTSGPGTPLTPAPDPPHERFIWGRGIGEARQYIVHTQSPRFIAELVDADDPDALTGLNGITLATSWDEIICNIAWIDPPPLGEADLHALRRDLETWLESIDAEW